LPGNNITTTVAHHVAVCKIYFPLSSGFQKHPGFRLAAFATFILAVRTNLDIVHLQTLFETLVHGFDCNTAYEPITDVGLVGNNDDQEIGALERPHGILHPWQQPKIFKPARSVWLPVADFAAVNYTIPVKEDCAAQRNC
jgi:hypothetical protein